MRRHSITVLAAGLALLWQVGATVAAETRPGPASLPAPGTAAPGAKAATPDTPAAGPGTAVAAPPFVYRSEGKSDPFKPFIETSSALQQKMKIGQSPTLNGRPISPLQQVEIDQFRLVGIAGDDQRRTAIVEDGVAKKHYSLFVGTYIGLNEGRVASILPDRVIVEERAQAGVQKGKIRRITIMLHREEEGKP